MNVLCINGDLSIMHIHFRTKCYGRGSYDDDSKTMKMWEFLLGTRKFKSGA